MIRESRCHRRTAWTWASVRTAERSNRPTKIVTVITQTRRRPMNVPVLRKTIRLPNLARATISVRTIVPLDKRRVHFSATRRGFQSRQDLFVRAKYRPVIDFRYSPVFTGFMDCRINQIDRRDEKGGSRTTRQTRRFRDMPFTERLQNRIPVRFIFVTCYQSRNLGIQAPSRFLYQKYSLLFRPFAIDHFQHELVFGIKGDVIPIVTATPISRVVFVAIFLLLFDEAPFLVELNFLGVRGKKQRVHRVILPHVLRRAGCSGSPFADGLFPGGLFFASHFPRRHAQGGKRQFLLAIANRKKPFHDAQKIVVYKSGNAVIGYRSARRWYERGYYFHPEHRVWGSFYSDNKTFSSRP